MRADTERARAMLEDGDFTCVLCRGNAVYSSRERGVKPLIGMLDSKIDFAGFAAADRIVGAAAAFLYISLGVTELYAGVLGKRAAELLESNGITCTYGTLTGTIRNRNGDGLCPMELAVEGISEPSEAEAAIRKRLKKLIISS